MQRVPRPARRACNSAASCASGWRGQRDSNAGPAYVKYTVLMTVGPDCLGWSRLGAWGAAAIARPIASCAASHRLRCVCTLVSGLGSLLPARRDECHPADSCLVAVGTLPAKPAASLIASLAAGYGGLWLSLTGEPLPSTHQYIYI